MYSTRYKLTNYLLPYGTLYIPRAANVNIHCCLPAWSRHQMEIFSALLALCEGNSRQVTRGFEVFFDVRLNKPLSKQTRWTTCMVSVCRNDVKETGNIFLCFVEIFNSTRVDESFAPIWTTIYTTCGWCKRTLWPSRIFINIRPVPSSLHKHVTSAACRTWQFLYIY